MAEMLKSNMKTFIGNSQIFRVLKVHDNDKSLLSLFLLLKESLDTQKASKISKTGAILCIQLH
jgi:hypothetical protein